MFKKWRKGTYTHSVYINRKVLEIYKKYLLLKAGIVDVHTYN